MVEKLLEDDPFLVRHVMRRIREEGREDEKRQEGLLVARQRSIVDVLALRFAPPALVVQQVAQYVEALSPRIGRLRATLCGSDSQHQSGRVSGGDDTGVTPWPFSLP